jgi:predicted O-methyltransferase YrrM
MWIVTSKRSVLLHPLEITLAKPYKRKKSVSLSTGGLPFIVMQESKGNPLRAPQIDPTSIFEHFRGNYGSELLAVAVAHFGVFRILNEEPLNLDGLREKVGLEPRAATVLVTALRAMGLLAVNADDRLGLTDQAREHLVAEGEFFVGDYIGLAATAPGVLNMVERLRTNEPANIDGAGAAFIYREGIQSAMEQEELARHFTLALSGRAKNVAPVLAEKVSMEGVNHLLDIGGGTGIYSVAFLRRHAHLRAAVVDLPHVLTVAREFARKYGVEDRIQFVEADMFSYQPTEPSELVLLSNILHDWDVATCKSLVAHYSKQLAKGGRLVIHDVFLNDELDGPLPIALYSAALFTLTEGRAYSALEYRGWMEATGLAVSGPIETLIHCGALEGLKRA